MGTKGPGAEANFSVTQLLNDGSEAKDAGVLFCFV